MRAQYNSHMTYMYQYMFIEQNVILHTGQTLMRLEHTWHSV